MATAKSADGVNFTDDQKNGSFNDVFSMFDPMRPPDPAFLGKDMGASTGRSIKFTSTVGYYDGLNYITAGLDFVFPGPNDLSHASGSLWTVDNNKAAVLKATGKLNALVGTVNADKVQIVRSALVDHVLEVKWAPNADKTQGKTVIVQQTPQ